MTHSTLPTLKDFLGLMIPVNNRLNSIKKNWSIADEESAILLSRSAWSMALITLLKQQQVGRTEIQFWVPDYFCSSSLDIVRVTNCRIHYYPITKSMEPDFAACRELVKTKGKPDIFLLVHYFGKPNTGSGKSVDFCKNTNAWLVEDAAHVLRPVKGVGDIGDFIMYSPHKLLPVPDGAILCGNSKGPTSLGSAFFSQYLTVENAMILFKQVAAAVPNYTENISVAYQLKWIVKKMLQVIGVRRFVKSNFLQEDNPDNPYTNNPKVSFLSVNLLSRYNKHKLDDVLVKRERNNLLWDDIIVRFFAGQPHHLLIAERPSYHNWCPYLSSYETDSTELTKTFFDTLNTKDFFVSTWPDLPTEVITKPELYPNAVALRNSRVYLPVHQSVPLRHLRRLIRSNKVQYDSGELPKLDIIRNFSDKMSWQSLMKNATNPVSMLQDWNYGQAKHLTEGWVIDRYLYSYEGKPVAIVQVLVKNIFGGIFKVYRVNRGPVFFTRNEKLIEAVIASITILGNFRKRSVLLASFNLERTPRNIAQHERYGFIIKSTIPYSSSYLDLSLSEQTLRSSLAGKWRNMLVYAEKRNINVSVASDTESVEWMCQVYEKNMVEKQFQGIQPALLKAYIDTENNNIWIYKAILDGQEIGAICIAGHGNTCTYLIGWTNEVGRNNKANYLLLWRAIVDLKAKGYLFFDSGGIDVFSTAGIANFKLGLNGELYTLTPMSIKL